MSLGPAIVAFLQADTAVAAIIVDRIYPEWNKDADHVYPLAVYKLDISPLLTNDGPGGIETATVTIAAIAERSKTSDQLARAIQTALDGKRGTWSGVIVQGSFLEDDGVQDDVVTDTSTNAILYYVKELTFTITYET